VFEQVEPTCDVTIPSDREIPTQKAADILVVIDNSGSMLEEQQNLADNFLNDNINECPIGVGQLADFERCNDEAPPAICRFLNPNAALLSTPGPEGLADCGFIQVLAAFENDFRVGVITTDVGACDDRSFVANGRVCTDPDSDELCVAGKCIDQVCAHGGQSPVACQSDGDCAPTWGLRPQRGCLQPDGPPSGATVRKIISREDLKSDDAATRDIGVRFRETLRNIQTFGSGFERGLDAMRVFLDKDTVRDPSCAGDLDAFLRPDAKLVVIFVSDEEDCSRLPGNTSFDIDERGDEFATDTCVVPATTRGAAGDCYKKVGELSAVSAYADFLRGLKGGEVNIATIAGGTKDADGTFVANGCSIARQNGAIVDGDPNADCWPARGNSNRSTSGDICSDVPTPNDADPFMTEAITERGCTSTGCARPCCEADAGGRYFELADAFGDQSVKDSICFKSFRDTMIRIAVKIGDDEFVPLAEEPENRALIFVEKAPAGSDDFASVARVVGDICGSESGWVLEQAPTGEFGVRFCGDARPGPGERIRVRAKGAGADPSKGAQACANRGG
jgi:hypothetical protein